MSILKPEVSIFIDSQDKVFLSLAPRWEICNWKKPLVYIVSLVLCSTLGKVGWVSVPSPRSTNQCFVLVPCTGSGMPPLGLEKKRPIFTESFVLFSALGLVLQSLPAGGSTDVARPVSPVVQRYRCLHTRPPNFRGLAWYKGQDDPFVYIRGGWSVCIHTIIFV